MAGVQPEEDPQPAAPSPPAAAEAAGGHPPPASPSPPQPLGGAGGGHGGAGGELLAGSGGPVGSSLDTYIAHLSGHHSGQAPPGAPAPDVLLADLSAAVLAAGVPPDWSTSESGSEWSHGSGLMTAEDETSDPVFIGADSARDSQPRAACFGDPLFQEFRYRASGNSSDGPSGRIPSSVYHSQTADSVCVGAGPGGATEVAVLSHLPPGVPGVPGVVSGMGGEPRGNIALYRLAEGGGSSLSAHSEMDLLATAELDFGAHTFARSPCGSFLAVGGDEGELEVYEVLREGGSVRLDRVMMAVIGVNGTDVDDVVAGVDDDSLAMNNSVRFCVIQGTLRLIVASQNRYVYILNIVTGDRRKIPPERPLYVSLLDSDGKYPWHSPSRPVDPEQHLGSTRQRALNWWAVSPQSPAASLESRHLAPGSQQVESGAWRAGTWHRGRTDAIGPFRDPVNCAEVSPDANWLAAVMDAHSVWVVPLSKRSWGKVKEFSENPRPLDRICSPHEALKLFVRRGSRGSWAPGEHEEVLHDPTVTFDHSGYGCQYCAWNPSSTLLAVSSDSLHVVNVFDVERHGTAVARFPYHETPCLGLSFTPWGNGGAGETLVWAQEYTSLHVALLDDFKRLPSCVDFDPPHRETYALDREAPRGLRRINGLGITPGGTVLLGLNDRMVGIKLLRHWSPETHSLFPEAFKAVVRAVVLGADPRGGSVLASLPTPLLQRILGRAAFPLAPWVLQGAGWKRLRSGPRGDGQPAYEGETPRRDPELTNRLRDANRRSVAAGESHGILSFIWPYP